MPKEASSAVTYVTSTTSPMPPSPKEAEQESLLLEFEVPYRPFGKAILDCLPPEGEQWVVPPKDPNSPQWKDRRFQRSDRL